MRAVVWYGPERLGVEDRADPVAGAGEVLLAPEAAGVCGSEVEGYLGRMANRTPPLIMGHEFAGRVVAVGEGVAASWAGRRAAVNPLLGGGEAPAGSEHLAAGRELLGIHRPGGFASLVSVPESALRALPDDADARVGALAEPLACGVHAVRLGLEALGGEAGRAVVLGAGTIGLMALQAAVLAGVDEVACIEPHEERRARARRLGAAAVHGSPDEPAAGVDLVVDAVGAQGTRRAALELVRRGGCVIMLGLATDTTPVDFHALVRSEVAVRGSYAYTRADYDRALGLLLAGRAGLGVLEPVLPLEAAPEVFAELARGASGRVKAFLGATA